MDSPETKMRSPDRVLVLSVIEGKKPLSTIGVADPRLFTGENKLHAVMDTHTTLWYLKYDMGVIPPPLQGRFTSFDILKKHCDSYFFHRNMEIKEVKD